MQTFFLYASRFYKPTLFALALSCCVMAKAQFTYDYKKNADNFYAKKDYFSAATYYEKYLEGKKDAAGFDPYQVTKASTAKPAKAKPGSYDQVVYRIADSYFKINDFAKAEKRYAEAVNFDKTLYPDTKLNYGISLRADGKYAEAQKQFESYLQEHTPSDATTELAKKELANCKFIQGHQKRKDAALYTVQKLGSTYNPQGANYAPSGYGSTFVFTSTRPDSALLKNKKKSPYVNNIYQLPAGSSLEKTTIALPENAEQGVSSFTADGNQVFFTRWVKKDGKNMAAIYTSHKKDGKWDEPVKLGTSVNEEGYSSQQPNVSADGKTLLFASDKPGGYGKFDLWYAPLDASAQAGKATNLGSSINTAADDEAPFYHQPSGTLVYATNGKVGMGGFDLFESKGNIGAAWVEPKNLGSPINSVKDDIYFYNTGTGKLLKNAFLSSDRSSACCLELFSADKLYRKYVSGVVTDCQTNLPIEGAVISAKDNATSKVVLASQQSSDQGKYLFESGLSQAIKIQAAKDGYNSAEITATQPSDDMDTLANIGICLVKIIIDTPKPEIVKAEPKRTEVGPFGFDEAKLRDKGMFVTLDSLTGLLKREPHLAIEIGGYTDEIGTVEYNVKLGEARAKACMEYMVQKGIEASRLTIKGYGKCCPIVPETTADGKDNPEARKVNRRVEFKISYL
ncbi:OmpA family protein [Parasediminibacterium sp. JCM 36343]|uniref:OmpA family protein n=1 Tax=Parasediminibacterium sp. JCM 36343 TaxID=3374279 RepID=UPI00397E42B6